MSKSEKKEAWIQEKVDYWVKCNCQVAKLVTTLPLTAYTLLQQLLQHYCQLRQCSTSVNGDLYTCLEVDMTGYPMTDLLNVLKSLAPTKYYDPYL